MIGVLKRNQDWGHVTAAGVYPGRGLQKRGRANTSKRTRADRGGGPPTRGASLGGVSLKDPGDPEVHQAGKKKQEKGPRRQGQVGWPLGGLIAQGT